MKRFAVTALVAVLTFGAAAPFLAADETTEVYRRIFTEAEGLSQKYAAALNLVRLEDRSVAPVLAGALEELLRTQKNYPSPSEKESYARIVRMLALALGDYKHADSAPFLWDVVQQVPDPLAQSEALIALGKVRALPWAERIALLLRDLNLKPTEDRDYGEKVAYGAILALERLRDVRGFSAVFFASDGWYSQRVKQQAERSLANIAEDPTDPIKEILANESAPRKVLALKAELASRAPAARKVDTAVLALELGHLKAPTDRAEGRVFADLRKTALRGAIALKAKGAAPVQGCLDSYNRGYDDEERLLGLSALGANGEDPAAEALRDIILKLNADQRSGVSDETRNRMAKAAIENAAISRNRLLRPALMSVAANDRWSGGIILAAQNAMKEIP